jgi:amino acid transporter
VTATAASSSAAAGELAAFLTGANLIMEYVFSNAAVARSFTAYLGTAVGVDAPSQWRITVHGLPGGFNQVDLVAVVVILLITVCICYRCARPPLLLNLSSRDVSLDHVSP